MLAFLSRRFSQAEQSMAWMCIENRQSLLSMSIEERTLQKRSVGRQNQTRMIRDIMGNQSYGQLKPYAEDRVNWNWVCPKPAIKQNTSRKKPFWLAIYVVQH